MLLVVPKARAVSFVVVPLNQVQQPCFFGIEHSSAQPSYALIVFFAQNRHGEADSAMIRLSVAA